MQSIQQRNHFASGALNLSLKCSKLVTCCDEMMIVVLVDPPSSSPSRVGLCTLPHGHSSLRKLVGSLWGDWWEAGRCSVVAAQSFAAPWTSQKCKDFLASHTQSDVDCSGLTDLFHAEVRLLLSSPTQPLPSCSFLSLFWLHSLFAWLAQPVKPPFAQHSPPQYSSSLFLFFFKALPDGEESH